MTQNNSQSSASKQRAAPCVHCRQMKVRCDVHENFPAACTRCGKSGRRCFIDPQYKRTARKDRLESMEREVRELRESLKSTPRQAQSPISESSRQESNGREIARSSEEVDMSEVYHHIPGAIQNFRAVNEKVYFTKRSIDRIEIDHAVISNLLEEYYNFHHERFPLLEDPTDCVRNFEKCPLLFWIIMAIASRGSDRHPQLYSVLQAPITRLASQHTLVSNRCVQFVQALLLLCVWPFPFEMYIEEPSWLYCGMATHMAMAIGLHMPFQESDTDCGIIRPDTKTRTWIACYIVDQKLSSRFGLPPTIKEDTIITSALSHPSPPFPSQLDHELHITYTISKASSFLARSESDTTGLLTDSLPLIRMLDAELGIVQNKYGNSWSHATEITFLSARLSLYAHILSPVSERCDGQNSNTGSAHASTNRYRKAEVEAEFTTAAAMTATRLLHIATSYSCEVAKGSAHVRMCVIYATIFLLLISRNPSTSPALDTSLLKNTISQTWAMLKEICEPRMAFSPSLGPTTIPPISTITGELYGPRSGVPSRSGTPNLGFLGTVISNHLSAPTPPLTPPAIQGRSLLSPGLETQLPLPPMAVPACGKFLPRILAIIEVISRTDWALTLSDPASPLTCPAFSLLRNKMGADLVLDVVKRAKDRYRERIAHGSLRPEPMVCDSDDEVNSLGGSGTPGTYRRTWAGEGENEALVAGLGSLWEGYGS